MKNPEPYRVVQQEMDHEFQKGQLREPVQLSQGSQATPAVCLVQQRRFGFSRASNLCGTIFESPRTRTWRCAGGSSQEAIESAWIPL